ncbi:vacuolar protein sorting-associated protein 35 [Chytridium lagenaria]|nr:vacuolar protein sorting-associated protein 35 [Chytridium lagenaria]
MATAISTTSQPTSGSSTPISVQDQLKILEEALNVVKVQSFHMKRCLDNTKLMDALKHCSTMLAELRTSSLTPKNYYELYMAIFDELQHLTTFLYDAHMTKRHHLSDLYELVQYAGNIVPRLYLMITVGSVYMRVAREQVVQKAEEGEKEVVEVVEGAEAAESAKEEDVPPIKELMKDMLEMARGVQHPTRGLFLRYYLSGMTRDYLPDEFIEMNKLWVRLQFQGHSKEREKREKERKELRLLVGSNLVRLSQLEGLDLEIFRGILEEIVSCRDVIAQEYLMEVIIQVFQDDFHLRTLDSFLSATAKLHRNVNVKQTVISLIDRFAAFAARAREESESRVKAAAAAGEEIPVVSSIPEDVPLFEVFWGQITELIQARPEFSVQDVVSLLVSLMNLSLNCYPERLDHADQILGFAKDKFLEALAAKSAYRGNPLVLLQFPSSSTQPLSNASADSTQDDEATGTSGWASQYTQSTAAPPPVTTQSLCGNYTDLLFLQPYATRRQVAHAIATACLRSHVAGNFRIGTVDGVDAVFGEVCSVMIRDQKDGGLFGPRRREGEDVEEEEELPLDWEDVVEEQNMVAKLVHLVKALLAAARKHFGEGGDIRIRFTLPPLVMNCIQLANKYNSTASIDSISLTMITIPARCLGDDPIAAGSVARKIGRGMLSPPDMSLRLFLMAAKSADEAGNEDYAYEFVVQALTTYEECVSESKAQVAAITMIVGAVYGLRNFGTANWDRVVGKCGVHCARLLKREVEVGQVDDGGKREVKRDGKKVLEYLQKALKIADSVMDQSVNVELFVEILEKYVWYFEKRNEAITVTYLNSLIDLIRTNLSNIDASATAPPSTLSHYARTGARRVPEGVAKHFENILEYLRGRQEDEGTKVGGFGETGGRYAEIDVRGR